MLPTNTFEGRVGIITGGGTGIGFAMARELVRLGATVVLASRKEEHLAPAAEKLRIESGRGSAAHYQCVDVREPDAVEEMVALGRECMDAGASGFSSGSTAGVFEVGERWVDLCRLPEEAERS